MRLGAMLVLVAAAPLAAQTAAGTAARRDSTPSIVLFASARVQELRFNAQPRVRIQLQGALGDSVRIVARENLPDTIVPGVTYRNVYVAIEILGHLGAQCISALAVGASPDSTRTCFGLSARDSVRRGNP